MWESIYDNFCVAGNNSSASWSTTRKKQRFSKGTNLGDETDTLTFQNGYRTSYVNRWPALSTHNDNIFEAAHSLILS